MADLSTPEGKLVEWLRLPKKPSECGNFVEVHAGLLTEAADALSRVAAERDGLREANEHANRMPRLTMDHRQAAERERDELKAEVERLREALKPFAAIAEQYSDAEDDDYQIWHDFDMLGATLPLKRFRRARAALRTPEESP